MNSIPIQLYDKDGNPAYPRPYYRIGDILESTNPNNPADDGYIGTWELYGKGRVTVCIDTDDSNFNLVNKEIGESTHTLTVNEMPSHSHKPYVYNSQSDGKYVASSNGTNSVGYSNVSTSNSGGGQAHNNIQKSIVVYRFRRIA